MKRISFFILAALLAAPLAGCGGGEETSEGRFAPPRRPAPQKQAQPEAPAEEEERKLLLETGEKLRNPFQSHLVVMREQQVDEEVRGPLECCELTAFTVRAIISAGEGSSALVLAPDGKRYIVKRGDVMGVKGGRVIRVDAEGITVREYKTDVDGKVVSTKDVVLKVPEKKTGGKKGGR